jgi:hypothetical protein
MKYRVFDTEAEALAVEAQIANDMGCVKISTNATTGLRAREAYNATLPAPVEPV